MKGGGGEGRKRASHKQAETRTREHVRVRRVYDTKFCMAWSVFISADHVVLGSYLSAYLTRESAVDDVIGCRVHPFAFRCSAYRTYGMNKSSQLAVFRFAVTAAPKRRNPNGGADITLLPIGPLGALLRQTLTGAFSKMR